MDGVSNFRLAAAYADVDGNLAVDATYPGLYEVGTATVTSVSVTNSGTPVSLVSGKFTTNEFIITDSTWLANNAALRYNALRCPPLYPHDKCFSKQITNILCITKPLKFLTPGAKQLTGYFDPSTGLLVDCCTGAVAWSTNGTYVKGDKVHIDTAGVNCYEYICVATEDCCIGTTASATIVIADSGGISQSDTFTLVDSAGLSTVYIINGGIAPASGGGTGGGTATVGFQGVGGGTAGKIAAANAMVIAIY